VEFDHDLAGGGIAFNRAIGFGDGRQREMPGIDAGRVILPASTSNHRCPEHDEECRCELAGAEINGGARSSPDRQCEWLYGGRAMTTRMTQILFLALLGYATCGLVLSLALHLDSLAGFQPPGGNVLFAGLHCGISRWGWR
jgi:hypothetical protein